MDKLNLKFNDRVQYMVKDHKGNYYSRVGYVKQVRKGIFRTKYLVCVAKSDVMHIIRRCDIISLIDKKDSNNAPSKSNNNGNI